MDRVSASGTRLWVAAPRHIKALLPRLSEKNVEWCYFGTNVTLKRRMASILGQVPSVSIAEELNGIAYEIKQPFMNWIAEIGLRQTNKHMWWASHIASKSPLQTDLFALVCYHTLFRNWIEDRRKSTIRLVVVEDPWLGNVLQQDFSSVPDVTFFGSRRDVLLDCLSWLLRVPFIIVYVILLHGWRRILASTIFSGSQSIVERPEDAKRRNVLLYTWIEHSCFRFPGRLLDGYTGRLDEMLGQHGEAIRRLTPFSMRSEFIWKLRPFARDVFVTQRYVTLGDVLKSAIAFFHVEGLNSLPELMGSRFVPLFYRELLHEWGRPGFAGYWLSYLAFRRLAKQEGNRIKAIIYPFENQPWEKLLCMAFKEMSPWVKMIGYQHASVPPLLLSYFLGDSEGKSAPLPDFIVTSGEISMNQFEEGGFLKAKLLNGGALRYEYLLSVGMGGESRKTEKVEMDTRQRRVLVALPTSLPHAEALLSDLMDRFIPSFFDKNHVEFIIKCHPDLPLRDLTGASGPLPQGFAETKVPLRDLFDTVCGFLYAPPTVSWCEAYVAGLPVIRYRSDFLNLDWADVFNLEDIRVVSTNTLKEGVLSLLNNPQVAPLESRRQWLGRALSPVNEKVWTDLVAEA